MDGLDFAGDLTGLVQEFNANTSTEARLAHDADQLALVLELKELMDIGYRPPHTWIEHVMARLQTETGREIGRSVMDTRRDAWWFKNSVDSADENN